MATEGILFIVFSNLGIHTQVCTEGLIPFQKIKKKKRMGTEFNEHEDGWEELRVKPNTAAS